MKLKGKNILVTGGAGFIGSNLVDRIILENPNKIVVVDNFFLGREENLNQAKKNFPDLSINRMDASDIGAMQELLTKEKTDLVFNLAVIPLPTSLEYPGWTFNTNVKIASTFCDLARWDCYETLVHCSSSEAYGTALTIPMAEDHPLEASTPYAASKAAADLLVLSYLYTFNIDTVIVRPFNNFGPRQNDGSYAGIIPIIINKVNDNLPVEIYSDGEQTRDYIFVEETAEAFVRIAETEATRGKVINIATGKEITINDLVARVLKVMGFPNHPVVHMESRPGDVRRHCGDISRAGKLIDFKSQGINDEYLYKTIEWYRKKSR